MNRVTLTDDLSLSRLVYGMWRIGDDADTSPAHVQAKIEACLDQGITTMDQADIYGAYTAEGILGAALRASPGLRDRIEIVTKCDIIAPIGKYADAACKHYDTSGDHIRAAVDTSLRDMGTDRIDLLLIHRPDPLMDPDDHGPALDALVASGKVRAVGVSNFRPWDVELLQGSMQTRLVTNQIEVSLAAIQPFTNGDLAFHQRRRDPVMAWSPLGGGSLMTGHGPVAAETGRAGGGIRRGPRGGGCCVPVAPPRDHPAGHGHQFACTDRPDRRCRKGPAGPRAVVPPLPSSPWARGAMTRPIPHSFVPDPQNGRLLRDAFGRFATGVTVVTAATEGGCAAMTANSFSSISMDPPLVMWSPALASSRFPVFAQARHFAIHVLAADQADLAWTVARKPQRAGPCGPVRERAWRAGAGPLPGPVRLRPVRHARGGRPHDHRRSRPARPDHRRRSAGLLRRADRRDRQRLTDRGAGQEEARHRHETGEETPKMRLLTGLVRPLSRINEQLLRAGRAVGIVAIGLMVVVTIVQVVAAMASTAPWPGRTRPRGSACCG